MSEIFRFIQVRPAEIKEVDTKVYTLGQGTTLQGDLANLKDQIMSDQMFDVSEQYLANNGVPEREDDDAGSENSLFEQLVLFHEEVENPEKDQNQSELEDKVSNHFSQTASALVASPDFVEFQSRLSDSIVASSISGIEKEEVLGDLIKAFRASNIISAIAEQDENLHTKDGLQEASNRVIQLPSAIFPLPSPQNFEPEGMSDNDRREMKKQDLRYEKDQLTAAIKELEAIEPEKLETIEPPASISLADPSADPVEPVLEIADSQDAASISNFITLSDAQPLILSEAGVNDLSPTLLTTLEHLEIKPAKLEVDQSIHIMENRLGLIEHEMAMLELSTYVPEDQSYTPGTIVDGVTYTPPKVIDKGSFRVLGVGDLIVVRKELKKYSRGEVAHVENVMDKESKIREHRRARKVDEFNSWASEEIEETEHHLSSTERFSLETEASEKQKEDHALNVGMKASANFGMVKVSGSVDYGLKLSREKSNRRAEKNAKETTEQLKTRVHEKVNRQRSIRSIQEFEEKNKHTIDNTSGTGHISGVYRWLDKTYLAGTYNYGKRMMMEFTIPEPAAFLLHRKKQDPTELRFQNPRPPKLGFYNLSPKLLTPHNYEKFVIEYQAEGVVPPPPRVQYRYFNVVSAQPSTKKKEEGSDKVTQEWKNEGGQGKIVIPEGYFATGAYASMVNTNPNFWEMLQISVGGMEKIMYYSRFGIANIFKHESSRLSIDLQKDRKSMPGLTGEVPVVVGFKHKGFMGVTLRLRCERDPDLITTWKKDTYEAIMRAYQARKEEYEEAVAALEIQDGITIHGNSPMINREIEKEELKKGAISLLTGRNLDFGGAMGGAGNGYSHIDHRKAAQLAKVIQFFEQSIDWEQMAYEFYPYFWARKEKWEDLQQIKDNDPEYRRFLRAGAARMLVPVREYHENRVLNYIETGGIADTPGFATKRFIHLAEEFKRLTENQSEYLVGKKWEVKVPTSLVMLDPDGKLPGEE